MKTTKIYTPLWFSKFGLFGAKETASCFKPVMEVANAIDAEALMETL